MQLKCLINKEGGKSGGKNPLGLFVGFSGLLTFLLVFLGLLDFLLVFCDFEWNFCSLCGPFEFFCGILSLLGRHVGRGGTLAGAARWPAQQE